jgi:ATP-dependent Clp protease ATP-binding subunit ClpC
MKYVDRLDAFVKLRIFTPDEIQELLRGVRIWDRDSYMAMVVDKCVAWLPQRAQGGSGFETAAPEEAREVLYEACVSLNPGLDIRRVLLPVTEARPGPGRPKRGKMRRLDPHKLGEALRQSIVGQDAAVAVVASAVARAFVGLRDPRRPIGTFLFVGPTGVGKTELARVLAAELADGEREALVRIDCSEYSQPHEYAKLIGAPPGYVGYEQGGYLTNVMAEAKAGVVLFDEIEKADERVHNLLLQIMDEGYCTDAKGQKIEFTDSLVILTSNIGTGECEALQRRLGFGMLDRGAISHAERIQATRQALGERFRPEFLNRVDETVVFRNLNRQDAAAIVDKFVSQLAGRARLQGLRLEVAEPVRDWIVEQGFSESYGARELRRCLQRNVENPLAEALLNGSLPRKGEVRVDYADGRVILRAPAQRVAQARARVTQPHQPAATCHHPAARSCG